MSAYAQAVIAFQKRIDLQLYNERMVTRVHELQHKATSPIHDRVKEGRLAIAVHNICKGGPN